MCILSFIPAGIPADNVVIDDLLTGGLLNGDGHGWALATDDGMLVGKSLRLDVALSDFADMRARYVDSPALFHSRWATHGSVREANCHPFNVAGSPHTVVAHNGVLPKSAHPKHGDDRSDTAILAGELMPRQWRKLDRSGVRQSLAQYCGRGNKLVILTTDPRYRRRHYLINEQHGIWDTSTGVWHSNRDYQTVAAYAGSPAVLGYGDDDPTSCDLCNQRVNDYNVCAYCDTCQDCYQQSGDCLCHIPESLRHLVCS